MRESADQLIEEKGVTTEMLDMNQTSSENRGTTEQIDVNQVDQYGNTPLSYLVLHINR